MVLRNAPLICDKTLMLNLSPLHPQNAIDFNPLTRHTLAGAEPEKDELRKKEKERCALCTSRSYRFILIQFDVKTIG